MKVILRSTYKPVSLRSLLECMLMKKACKPKRLEAAAMAEYLAAQAAVIAKQLQDLSKEKEK